jgi:hypothetical protein
MIKSVSLGIGAFLLILGLALHAVDSYTVRPKASMNTSTFGIVTPTAKVVVPEPWKPWAYIGSGVVLCLWTCTLPAKLNGKK